MREDGPSLTATLVAAVRALYTELEEPLCVAPDPVARALLPPHLALPVRAAGRARWLGPVVHRVVGAAAFGLSYGVELRTGAIDDAIERAVGEGVRRIVLLGAGLDARAYRLAALADAEVLEVDHPAMARYRRARFDAAERATGRPIAPVARRVTSVSVDFERERLDDALRAAGVAADAPTFFLWEGVTMYLTPEAIRETLRAVGALAAPGSHVAVTYAPPAAPATGWLMPLGRALARVIREPLLGLMRPDEVVAALAREGFVVESDESPADWAPRRWPGRHGRVHVWERLAVARRPA
jgi:methyltransferase (TIGR00027 family)